MQSFTVETRAGKVFTVESNMTDAEAQNVLAGKADASDFERKLAKPDRAMSPKMRAWLHVLATWTITPKAEVSNRESFPNILAMLARARDAGKKFPKIKLDVDGKPIVLALSRAGKVNVTDGLPYGENVWFGAIQPTGLFHAGREANGVLATLHALEADPVAVATQHGVATGNCCFCARELTTRESRSVGYGPVCSEKFGLPWGDVDPEFDASGRVPFSM